jgi:hypothetical protein
MLCMHWGGTEVQLYLFLTSALDEGGWSTPHPCHLILGGKSPSTHCTGGCLGPSSGVGGCGEEKIFCLHWGLNPEPFSSLASHCTNCAITAPSITVIFYSVGGGVLFHGIFTFRVWCHSLQSSAWKKHTWHSISIISCFYGTVTTLPNDWFNWIQSEWSNEFVLSGDNYYDLYLGGARF